MKLGSARLVFPPKRMRATATKSIGLQQTISCSLRCVYDSYLEMTRTWPARPTCALPRADENPESCHIAKAPQAEQLPSVWSDTSVMDYGHQHPELEANPSYGGFHFINANHSKLASKKWYHDTCRKSPIGNLVPLNRGSKTSIVVAFFGTSIHGM
jgi:hypothetical protein